MDIFKNIKDIFIEEVKDTSPKSKRTTSNKKPATSKEDGGNRIIKVEKKDKPIVSNLDTQKPIEGEVNEKFLNILFDSLEQNNLDGFDYFEFKKSLQALEKMPMDEATRYRSAFAMASSMGVDATNLVRTASHYLKVLSEEDKKFQQALAQQNNAGVGSKQSALKKLESSVQQKANQIKKLTEEIATLQKQIESTKQTIAQASHRILKTKSDFEKSYQYLKAQIDTDVTKMKTYLLPKQEKPKDK